MFSPTLPRLAVVYTCLPMPLLFSASPPEATTTEPDPTVTQDAMQTALALAQGLVQALDDALAQAGNGVMAPCQPWLEPLTASVGQVVAPVANHPFMQGLTLVPGLRWLLAALGQVNVNQVRQGVDDLRRTQPQADRRALARQVMADTTLKAAGVGLATNLAPPLAILLSWVDVGAVAALQATMIYRIAAIYGYSPEDSERRGEVFTVWLLSASASGLVKSGLGLVETLPWLGTAVGVATDATLIYSVGYWACRYYETKQTQPTEVTVYTQSE